MGKTYSNFDKSDGTKLYYQIIMKDGKENGFDVFEGENSEIPVFHQPEPWIPNHSLSYAENAINLCKEISESSNIHETLSFVMTEEMYNQQQSDIDYLMILLE